MGGGAGGGGGLGTGRHMVGDFIAAKLATRLPLLSAVIRVNGRRHFGGVRGRQAGGTRLGRVVEKISRGPSKMKQAERTK